VKIYEYLRENGIRSFIFLVDPWFESFATVKGRKRVNLKKLLLKTKLRKRDLSDVYEIPDKELLVDMIIPPDKFRDAASRKKRI
jgi:hypothetical protein